MVGSAEHERQQTPVVVARFEVSLEHDHGARREQFPGAGRGLGAEALGRAAGVDRFGRVDAEEANPLLAVGEAHLDRVAVDDLDDDALTRAEGRTRRPVADDHRQDHDPGKRADRGEHGAEDAGGPVDRGLRRDGDGDGHGHGHGLTSVDATTMGRWVGRGGRWAGPGGRGPGDAPGDGPSDGPSDASRVGRVAEEI